MKTLYTLVLMAMISLQPVLFHAQKVVEKSHSASAKTRTVNTSRAGVSKRPASTSPSRNQTRPSANPASALPERAESRTTSTHTASKPAVQETKVETKAAERTVANTENDFNYKEVFQRNAYYHRRQMEKQRRHCGCGGDIVFVNKTSDTLDLYFGYLSPSQVPTIENAVLPYLTNVRMVPSFYIPPNGSATIRGGCSGGIQYEALVHKQKGVPMTSEKKNLHIQGSIRASCKPQRMVYLEDPLLTE